MENLLHGTAEKHGWELGLCRAAGDGASPPAGLKQRPQWRCGRSPQRSRWALSFVHLSLVPGRTVVKIYASLALGDSVSSPTGLGQRPQ
jgi:hypothetical protein